MQFLMSVCKYMTFAWAHGPHIDAQTHTDTTERGRGARAFQETLKTTQTHKLLASIFNQ